MSSEYRDVTKMCALLCVVLRCRRRIDTAVIVGNKGWKLRHGLLVVDVCVDGVGFNVVFCVSSVTVVAVGSIAQQLRI